MVGPSAKKKIVSYLKEAYSTSTRVVSRLVGLARSLYYRKSLKDDRLTETKLNELATEYPTRDLNGTISKSGKKAYAGIGSAFYEFIGSSTWG